MELTRGYIGLTDPDWHSYLSKQPRVEEVNFWQPHGSRRFAALTPGEPFFFKLRAPQKAIAGFGFFQRYESLPAWLAWECFGTMNGAPDFPSMIERITRLRGEGSAQGDFPIGCIMISAPVFFSQQEWIDPPNDWAPTGIQQGKRYELGSGEGKRIYAQCMEGASRATHYWNVDRVAEPSERYGTPVIVRPRLGQGLFSFAVRDAYKGACAVTGEHSTPVLEAAHIKPYAQGGEHSVRNGLLLRSDLHRLFDKGYVTVTPDYRFQVGKRLREEYKNGRTYYQMSGSPILLPEDTGLLPDRNLLDWHQNVIFGNKERL
jgi:putative restriction endonuclease